MDCKAMTTPMASNLKLLSDASSVGWCYDVLSHDWVLNVLDEYETRYLLCCEHIEPVLDGSETCSLDGCKACRGTIDYGLKYEANQKINLEGYVDSDWAGNALQGVASVWDQV